VARLLDRLGIPWEYCTRAIGFGLLAYGLLVDETPERGTIILAGVGFLGLDKVAKSEPSEKKNGK
jgi:hypothetical protein